MVHIYTYIFEVFLLLCALQFRVALHRECTLHIKLGRLSATSIQQHTCRPPHQDDSTDSIQYKLLDSQALDAQFFSETKIQTEVLNSIAQN